MSPQSGENFAKQPIFRTERPVYYLSDRPEAYEVWGEVSLGEARKIALLIASKAGELFPDVDFRVDGGWHQHEPGLAHVAATIEENWQNWLDSTPP